MAAICILFSCIYYLTQWGNLNKDRRLTFCSVPVVAQLIS